ncbi:hypothetical protein ACLB1R_17955 [Escherichia coli]
MRLRRQGGFSFHQRRAKADCPSPPGPERVAASGPRWFAQQAKILFDGG